MNDTDTRQIAGADIEPGFFLVRTIGARTVGREVVEVEGHGWAQVKVTFADGGTQFVHNEAVVTVR